MLAVRRSIFIGLSSLLCRDILAGKGGISLLTESQYMLLSQLRENSVELPCPLPDDWAQVKQYMYVVRTFDMICTTGTKVVPWMWSINAYGLDELALYEKAREKHSDECAQKRAEKRKNISRAALRLVEGVVIAILAEFIIKVVG